MCILEDAKHERLPAAATTIHADVTPTPRQHVDALLEGVICSIISSHSSVSIVHPGQEGIETSQSNKRNHTSVENQITQLSKIIKTPQKQRYSSS